VTALKSAAFLFYGQKPPNPDAALNEAFLAGKSAAAAKGTDGNKNRPELRALPAAIAAVCARLKPPLKPAASETFAESIRADVRHEIYAAVDSKTKKRLLSRKPEWPSAPVIKRTLRAILKECVGT
jgi:hypothetical protein